MNTKTPLKFMELHTHFGITQQIGFYPNQDSEMEVNIISTHSALLQELQPACVWTGQTDTRVRTSLHAFKNHKLLSVLETAPPFGAELPSSPAFSSQQAQRAPRPSPGHERRQGQAGAEGN